MVILLARRDRAAPAAGRRRGVAGRFPGADSPGCAFDRGKRNILHQDNDAAAARGPGGASPAHRIEPPASRAPGGSPETPAAVAHSRRVGGQAAEAESEADDRGDRHPSLSHPLPPGGPGRGGVDDPRGTGARLVFPSSSCLFMHARPAGNGSPARSCRADRSARKRRARRSPAVLHLRGGGRAGMSHPPPAPPEAGPRCRPGSRTTRASSTPAG